MLRKFLRLPRSKQFVLVEAVVLLVTIRAGLCVFTFSTVRRGLDLVRVLRPPFTVCSYSRARIQWGVYVADRYLPGTDSCLERALTAEHLLRAHGHSGVIRIGVDGDRDEFAAHAWVESEGQVIVGGGDLSSYTELQPDEAG